MQYYFCDPKILTLTPLNTHFHFSKRKIQYFFSIGVTSSNHGKKINIFLIK